MAISAPVMFFKRNGWSSQSVEKTVDVQEREQEQKGEQEREQEEQLHQYRNRIQEHEAMVSNGKNWEYYKKIVNPYEWVYTQKKYDIFPSSVCSLHPLSRSYFKMIEMMEVLRLFDTPLSTLKTAHVCEGPGGFIEALFDRAKQLQKGISVSIAMTLRPIQTRNIPGWKRASSFLRSHRNIKIIYGEDNTGDILKPENQQYFIDYATPIRYGGKVDIFTADGGFDFSSDYERQETTIFPLLLASTKIGLEVVKPGGAFILKIFDFYKKPTTDLLFFLSCHFEEWTLYKPCMSRPCNPEHYFIGKGFTGCTEESLDWMRMWCLEHEQGKDLPYLFSRAYPPEFTEQLRFLQSRSFHLQKAYLERVFEMIRKNEDQFIQEYLKANYVASREWCIAYNVPLLPPDPSKIDPGAVE